MNIREIIDGAVPSYRGRLGMRGNQPRANFRIAGAGVSGRGREFSVDGVDSGPMGYASVQFRGMVDGSDFLYIQGFDHWLSHRNGDPPSDVMISGSGQAKRRGEARLSWNGPYYNNVYDSTLWRPVIAASGDTIWVGEFLGGEVGADLVGRTAVVQIVQQPSGGSPAIILINDDSFGGSALYDFTVTLG